MYLTHKVSHDLFFPCSSRVYRVTIRTATTEKFIW